MSTTDSFHLPTASEIQPPQEATPEPTSSSTPQQRSYAEVDTDEDEISSLPSSIDSSDDEEYRSNAQEEWEQSLQQLELLLTMVLVPYMGKYFGRKFAYWGWAKYMTWKHADIEVAFTSKAAFKASGALEAAATL